MDNDSIIQNNIKSWLEGNYDESTKNEILQLETNSPEELKDCFRKKISFGTGGVRGIVGPGYNRINKYVIRGFTQGVAEYLLEYHSDNKDNLSVFIGFDTRINSHEFALETAKVFAANNIKVIISEMPSPVALVSFAIQKYNCAAGVLITASHNPKQYNGYKLYWNTGVQVTEPHDKEIEKKVKAITDLSAIKTQTDNTNNIITVGDEILQSYIEAMESLKLQPFLSKNQSDSVKIVYTNLHGSGLVLIPSLLRNWGFSNISLVENQRSFDGNFPTVDHPNPEDRNSFSYAILCAKENNAQIALATDPDSDRLGLVEFINDEQKYFSGNQLAIILATHILQNYSSKNIDLDKYFIIKSIVTTELLPKIASDFKARSLNVLTGFKYIGEKIVEFENPTLNPDGYKFLFGAEDSYGYLYGTLVRDKDAIVASACLCDATLYAINEHGSLSNFLKHIYSKYGIHYDKTLSLEFPGLDGEEKIHSIMDNIRNMNKSSFCNINVLLIEDYLTSSSLNLQTNKKEAITLPTSNVLKLLLEDNTKIVFRPSGTEPKIKIYCETNTEPPYASDEEYLANKKSCKEKVDNILAEIKSLFLN